MTVPTEHEKDLMRKAIIAFVRFILHLRKENEFIEDAHIIDAAREVMTGGKLIFSRDNPGDTAAGVALWAEMTAEYLIRKKLDVS